MTLIGCVIISWLLAYFRAGLWIWTAASLVLLWSVFYPIGSMLGLIVWTLFVVVALILNAAPFAADHPVQAASRTFQEHTPPVVGHGT